MVILEFNTAPPVFPLKLCLGRVWLEAKRKFCGFALKNVALYVGAHHVFFNMAVKLPSEAQCQPYALVGAIGQARTNPGEHVLPAKVWVTKRDGALAEIDSSVSPAAASCQQARDGSGTPARHPAREACGSLTAICLSQQIGIEEKGAPSGDSSQNKDVF